MYMLCHSCTFRTPSPELNPEERDARTVFCMQLAARIRPRDLEEFFSAVGKVHKFMDFLLTWFHVPYICEYMFWFDAMVFIMQMSAHFFVVSYCFYVYAERKAPYTLCKNINKCL